MLALAIAAGLFFPDLGAKALGRGATGAAGAGDLSAMESNPAGLASLEGLRLQAEISSAWQPLDFTRAGDCGAAPCITVSNSAGAFLNTVSGISYAIKPGLVIAAGIYGPPSIGRETFPDPRAVSSPVTQAPQRYSMIAEDNLVLYPGIGLGWRVLDWLDLGGVFQLRYFHAKQSQTIYSLQAGGESPNIDAVASADATDSVRPVFGLGAIARPLPGLSLGLSWRPAEPVHANGTLDVQLPEFAKAVGASVTGNSADIDLTLAPQVRLGARYDLQRFSAMADVVWENWGVLRRIDVTPLDLVLHEPGQPDYAIPPLSVPRNWHAAWSVRVGAEYAALDWLRVRAGALYETSAIPPETQQIDFATPDRFALTAGATAAFDRLSATVGYAHFFEQDRDVTGSQVNRIDAYPDAPPYVIGNGHYSTSLDVLALQLTATL